MIAGTEFKELSDEELNEIFDGIMSRSKVDLGIKLFIQRTDKWAPSTYDFFVDGQAVGDTYGFKDLRYILRRSINQWRYNRGLSLPYKTLD